MWTLCVGDVLAIVLLLAVLLFINVRVASFVFVVFWPLVCFVVVLSSLRVGVVLYVVVGCSVVLSCFSCCIAVMVYLSCFV